MQVVRASPDYYQTSLLERKAFLKAHSTFSLCKTIIMENTRYEQTVATYPEIAKDAFYPRYVMVITQFEEKLAVQKIV